MAKIQIKRGDKASLPQLSLGEFGLSTDTQELFIGGNDGNLQIPVMGEDITELWSGAYSMPGSNITLSESVYNFECLYIKTSDNIVLCAPIFPNISKVIASAWPYTTESFTLYSFTAYTESNGTVLSALFNYSLTVFPGNPMQSISPFGTYTITNIYGIGHTNLN